MAPEGAAAMVSIKWCLWAAQLGVSIGTAHVCWKWCALLQAVSGRVPQAVIVA